MTTRSRPATEARSPARSSARGPNRRGGCEMSTVDAQAVIEALSRQIADLTVRLAVAEARAEQAERSLVDLMAEQEAAGAED